MYYSKRIFCTLLLLTSLYNFSQPAPTYAHESIAIIAGFNRGFGINAQFTFHNFAPDIKGHIRFGVGYTILNPGNAKDVQKIFVGDATNGVSSRQGKTIDFRIDYLMAKKFFNFDNSYLFFGPRYVNFEASFNNAEENFNVTYRQVGLGIGAENYFYLDRKFDLVVATGIDYFFPGTLYGPRTFYKPTNENINATTNPITNKPYNYKDANKAIKQPQLMPRIFVGIAYYL